MLLQVGKCVSSGARCCRKTAPANWRIMCGLHNGLRFRSGIDMRNDDPFCTNIQCPKNLAGLMASYADHGRDTKAFGCAYVVFQLEGFSTSMLSINEREIESRRRAHFYECGRRHFDDKPV